MLLIEKIRELLIKHKLMKVFIKNLSTTDRRLMIQTLKLIYNIMKEKNDYFMRKIISSNCVVYIEKCHYIDDPIIELYCYGIYYFLYNLLNEATRDNLYTGLKDSMRYLNNKNLNVSILACEVFYLICKDGNNIIRATLSDEYCAERLSENLLSNNLTLSVYTCRLLLEIDTNYKYFEKYKGLDLIISALKSYDSNVLLPSIEILLKIYGKYYKEILNEKELPSLLRSIYSTYDGNLKEQTGKLIVLLHL